MKRALIEIVIDIMNDMDSDEISSIEDTMESMQVAQIVKSCYFEMMSNRNWPTLQKLISLDHSATLDRPTHLKMPENIKELILLKYDNTKKGAASYDMREIIYLHPDEFLRVSSSTNIQMQNVRLITDTGGTKLVVRTNQAPRYWTSFDDEWIVCDSYDIEQEDALKASKTQALVYTMPKWTMSDDFVPDLPAEAFSALIEEAKSTAFLALKQMGNDKAEQKSARQQRWLSRKAWQAHGGVRYSDYGRRGRK